jgi:hypothetical protein
MSSHILIHKHSVGGQPSGANGLLGWAEYASSASGKRFHRVGAIGQLAHLAMSVAAMAIDRGANVTVAFGSSDPAKLSPDEMEGTFLQLQPRIIVCPERPGKTDRWSIVSGAGTPESLPAAAIQAAINSTIGNTFPRWLHGLSWNATAFLLRFDVNAEARGLVDPEPLTGDRILGMVATDEVVHEANKVADPSIPESIYALAAARLAAQERRGIPEDKRVVMFSSEAENLLTGPLMRMGRGDETATLALLRRQLRAYGPLADFALTSALRDFGHAFPYLENLREAAKAQPASAA